MSPERIDNEEQWKAWRLEVCVRCGLQLGPGLNSPTQSGRCPEHDAGGVVLDVKLSDDLARTLAHRADRDSRAWREGRTIATLVEDSP